jgi:chromosome segregation ATPase
MARDLKAQNSRLATDAQGLRAHRDQLAERNERQRNTIIGMQKESRRLEKRNSNQSKWLRESWDDNTKFEKEVKVLQRDVVSLRIDRNNLRVANRMLKTRNEELKNKVEDLADSSKYWQGSAKYWRMKYDEGKELVEKLTAQIESYQKGATHCAVRIRELEDNARNDKKALAAAVNHQEKQNKRIQKLALQVSNYEYLHWSTVSRYLRKHWG